MACELTITKWDYHQVLYDNQALIINPKKLAMLELATTFFEYLDVDEILDAAKKENSLELQLRSAKASMLQQSYKIGLLTAPVATPKSTPIIPFVESELNPRRFKVWSQTTDESMDRMVIKRNMTKEECIEFCDLRGSTGVDGMGRKCTYSYSLQNPDPKERPGRTPNKDSSHSSVSPGR